MDFITALSAVITRLRKEGYTENFDLRKHLLTGQRSALQLTPDEFVVDSQHHFGDASDSANAAVVYAISSLKFNVKGTLVNGHHVSSNGVNAAFIRVLTEKIRVSLLLTPTATLL